MGDDVGWDNSTMKMLVDECQKKCSRSSLEVLGIIQNDVKIGQVYIILDDLSHKWKKRHRPQREPPTRRPRPCDLKGRRNVRLCWSNAPGIPGQAGPGVSNTGGRTDGPVPVPACRRARARTQSSSVFTGGCALAGSIARGKSSVPSISASKKQSCEKAYCAPAMKFRLLGRWFLCSCLWNCYFPVVLELTAACFSSWFVDRLTHCVRISLRIGIWKPPYVIVIAGSPGFARWEKRNLFGCQKEIGQR